MAQEIDAIPVRTSATGFHVKRRPSASKPRRCKLCRAFYGGKRGQGSWCSDRCRFWGKVKVLGGDKCWLWVGAVTPRGYGKLTEGWRPTRHVAAHRHAFEAFHGPVPAGLLVCHRCDIRLCMNPAHLFAGTAQENFDDMLAKGRAYWQKHPTPAKVKVERTACPSGHPYDGNAYRSASGALICRPCRRLRERSRRERGLRS